MAEEFLLPEEGDDRVEAENPFLVGRERVKHYLVGSPRVVTMTIRSLHVLGYAEAAAWSKPQLAGALGQPGEVISVLIKHVPLE